MEKKILITGASGQLGYELQRTAPNNYQLIPTDVSQLDICDLEKSKRFITAQQPDIIINAAAYTAVDKAEKDVDLAWQVNHLGAENLAKISAEHNITLIQISTDFIFDGKQSHPYLEETYSQPSASVYGNSKLAGEQSVLSFASQNSLIIRTSWLYSSHGNNFVKSMLELMKNRDKLGIVSDQIGSPTWAKTLAKSIWSLEAKNAKGIFHCSDNGVASWYDFSVAIQKAAIAQGLLDKEIPIKPIRTEDYPTPATRPQYSVMDKTKIEATINETLPHWQHSLDNMLKELTS